MTDTGSFGLSDTDVQCLGCKTKLCSGIKYYNVLPCFIALRVVFLLIIRSILLLSIFLLFVTIKIKITIEGGGCAFFLLCRVLINELNEIKLFTNN